MARVKSKAPEKAVGKGIRPTELGPNGCNVDVDVDVECGWQKVE